MLSMLSESFDKDFLFALVNIYIYLFLNSRSIWSGVFGGGGLANNV
jgi:hypothetical protein